MPSTGVASTGDVLGDGVTLIALLELAPDGGHPLAGFPAYAELVENLKGWYAEPPTVERMTVIGSAHDSMLPFGYPSKPRIAREMAA